MKFGRRMRAAGGAAFVMALGTLARTPAAAQATFRAAAPGMVIEFDEKMQSRLLVQKEGQETPLNSFAPAESVLVNGKSLNGFAFKSGSKKPIQDKIGNGTQYRLVGEADTLREELSITTYANFPALAILQARYTNIGGQDAQVDGWWFQRHLPANSDSATPPFWSYQSGSYEKRPDWVLPLHAGFRQENFMGMNDTDYGGGTPISDVWRRDVGIAIGHVEPTPKLVSLAVTMPDASGADLRIEAAVHRALKPNESFQTLRTFVTVHHGDYFDTLTAYRRLMTRNGIRFAEFGKTPYEPVWCGWGYGRGFTPAQIYAALPKAAELGFKWAVIDDGWQDNIGDWNLNPTKFPRGDADMRAMTARIRAGGMRPELWWAPMAAHPSSQIFKEHPDWLLVNESGQHQRISYWNAFYLCPAYKPVQEYTKALVVKMLRDWDFDGLKLDGQHLNAAPPCYNPAHHHAAPQEAYEQEAALFKLVYETAKQIKPDAVVELCPCGDAYTFYNLPFMNQSVASDPESSWQIRTKGKTLKALMGVNAPYLGDYVELSDGGNDFASTLGVGGVVGSMFRWPPESSPNRNDRAAMRARRNDLTEAKESDWKKWVALYEDKRLSQGEYLGSLYDIGFDRPEAHAIRKDGRLYYAFYAKDFQGPVELRGLDRRAYRIRDYESDKDYGSVHGPTAPLMVSFQKHLLLEAIPVTQPGRSGY
jgi:alpha-galactosidase